MESSAEPATWVLIEKNGTGFSVLREEKCAGKTSASLAASLQAAALPAWDEIWVGTGPGSFSGIRVAIATALGLSAARGGPVRAVRSTHALAWRFREDGYLGVFADARRGKIFFTAYARGRLVRPTELWDAALLDEALGKCSRAVSVDGLAGVPECAVPDALSLAHGVCTLDLRESLPLEPVYLHPVLENKIS